MDTLTFKTPILFRHLTFSEAKKQPISEINLQAALDGLGMDMDQVMVYFNLRAGLIVPIFQFVELCILLGCDYLEPIKGVGPKSALKLIKEHGSLKTIVKHLRAKYVAFSIVFVLNTFPLRRSESKKAAAAEQSDSEDVASEADEPAPTSDIEVPDVQDGSEREGEEPVTKKKKASAKKGKKRKGGVMIPDEWPWEEAKKIFVNPEVLPADEVEVSMLSHHLIQVCSSTILHPAQINHFF
jgi:flap endonuclease-1